jgi:hypothetical protein
MTNTTSPAVAAAAPKRRKRVNWTPTERSEWLALFDGSGQSEREFCRTNGLRPATLSLWREREAGTDRGKFVEVPRAAVMEAARTRAAVVVHLSGGITLEISADADPVWVGAVVKNLGGARS